MLELMVAVTLVPAALAVGFALESAQPMPAGAVSMVQVRGTGPANPFKPFTKMVSVMFVPTLVATVAVFAVTVKSLTDSVTLVERVRSFNAALTPEMVTVVFAGRAAPKSVCRVTTEVNPVTPGVIVGGLAEQCTPVGRVLLQPTAMSCVMPPSGVKVTV